MDDLDEFANALDLKIIRDEHCPSGYVYMVNKATMDTIAEELKAGRKLTNAN